MKEDEILDKIAARTKLISVMPAKEIRLRSAMQTLRDIKALYGPDIMVKLPSGFLKCKQAIKKVREAAKKEGIKLK